ncbi:type III-B CRISPR module-associated protein Cmr3 [Halothiobacillus diazotrophicus]|uniref:Type III-B CRISPR module-associated protein Cmr3 n=1 Tax=Halothiobacillus diazotrophicus TaxID=1860122 RepID=A0A191ZFN2_9GAMM|nr:type III-B CRISPR module-associated protein Cmr3 [Halothiobacillus diazotrophicus]ANJ66662.1 type III-B CRISPR module-associated protein Cmr3 [Halothiobacillus diazotrophicus]
MAGHKKHKPIRYDKKKPAGTGAHNAVQNPEPRTGMARAASGEAVRPPSPVQLGLKAGRATLAFDAADTLFFRESRPMEAMGELQSVFPPPMRTLAGAVRTLIGESAAVDWQAYRAEPAHSLRQIIGYDEELGSLSFRGVWLALNGERLYPAPLHLLRKPAPLHLPGEAARIYPLHLDKSPVWCDLGRRVRLPALPEDRHARGARPMEDTWLTREGLARVLAGHLPDPAQLRTADQLFFRESRVGIARDNRRRTVIEGMLYQTRHIRPQPALSIEVDASGLPDSLPNESLVRLGGEGRAARLSVLQKAVDLPAPGAGSGQGIALYLLTPLLMPGGAWLGFARQESGEAGTPTVWTGTLNGIALTLHGAVTGKALRSGGWDMTNQLPRPVTSFVPAGSVFFCTVEGDVQAACEALHDRQIGVQTEYGYGHLAVGPWQDQ